VYRRSWRCLEKEDEVKEDETGDKETEDEADEKKEEREVYVG
jgi:hypothetical protein